MVAVQEFMAQGLLCGSNGAWLIKIKKNKVQRSAESKRSTHFLHDQIKSKLKDLLCGLCDDIFR